MLRECLCAGSFRNSSVFRVNILDNNSLLADKVGVDKATQLLSRSSLTSGNTLPSAFGKNSRRHLSLRSSFHKGNSARRLGSCIAIEVMVGTIHIRIVFLLPWVRLFPALCQQLKMSATGKRKDHQVLQITRHWIILLGFWGFFQCLDFEKLFSLCPSPKS